MENQVKTQKSVLKQKQRRSLSNRPKDYKINLSKKILRSYRPLHSKTTMKLESDLNSPELSPERGRSPKIQFTGLENLEEKKHTKFIKDLGFLRSDVERAGYLKFFSNKLLEKDAIFGERKDKDRRNSSLYDLAVRKGKVAKKKAEKGSPFFEKRKK